MVFQLEKVAGMSKLMCRLSIVSKNPCCFHRDQKSFEIAILIKFENLLIEILQQLDVVSTLNLVYRYLIVNRQSVLFFREIKGCIRSPNLIKCRNFLNKTSQQLHVA